MLSCRLLSLLTIIALSCVASSAEPSRPRANYEQAAKFSYRAIAPVSYSTFISPGWVGKTDSFWYANRTSKGTRFWLVSPVKRTRVPLFDHEKLAAQLAELARKPVEAHALPVARGLISADGKTFTFTAWDMAYALDRATGKLTVKGKAPAGPPAPRGPGRRRTEVADRSKGPAASASKAPNWKTTSPDKKSVVLLKDHNLYLAEAGKEKEAVCLTKDGAEECPYFVLSGLTRRGGPRGPIAPLTPWSKDSRHFYATRRDSRGVKELFVINSLAQPRPALEKFKYSMPGEDAVRKLELYVGSREAKALARVKPKWKDESYLAVEWDRMPGQLRFIRRDRLGRNLEYCALEAATGDVRVFIREGFENAPVDYQQPRYLESGEMLWWSERTGWGHFYLYNKDGTLKNAITSGPWRASQVVAVDEKARVLYVRGNAREKGENVYYSHLYSVKFDGTGLTLLDPGNASHFSFLSPSRKFVVDNSSRIDEAPFTVLRDEKGAKVMELETADVSGLKELGWKPPETFVVKAADGVTDLYGNLYKPFDFDPKKKYPIIAHVYPGPQDEGVTHTFSAFSPNMQLAQLGFIVVQVGHRGGSPVRSKAYASHGYFNLRDFGLEDKKRAIEQLAARHAWIDIKKVGIYGHSGGGFMSAAALLQKPYNEFFKAAVASAGNHDNNIYNNYWAERYHGMKEVPVAKAGTRDATKGPAGPPTRETKKAEKKPPAAPPATRFEIKVPTNAELAANLKGRLLLVHGEIDNNVHPANTMRLVDALIKANKRFDLLIIPGKRHGFGDASEYFRGRMYEFFAEHLLGDRRRGADLLGD